MNHKSLQFHLESGDYFGTLATTLDLLRQDLFTNEEGKSFLEQKVKELEYLQNKYKINKK